MKREERTHKRPFADDVLILRPPGPLAERSMTGNRLEQADKGRALGQLLAGTQKAAKNVMRRGGGVPGEEWTKGWCGVADSRDARLGNVVCCLTIVTFSHRVARRDNFRATGEGLRTKSWRSFSLTLKNGGGAKEREVAALHCWCLCSCCRRQCPMQ